MIPSRPLEFGEIYGQTFSLFGRVFARYAAIFLICFLPGTWMLTSGSTSMVSNGLRLAKQELGLTDTDLVAIRDVIRDSIARDNPAFRDKLETAREKDSVRKVNIDSMFTSMSARSRLTPEGFVEKYVLRFSTDAVLMLFGMLLLTLGLLVLQSIVSDFTCQEFEERSTGFWNTIGATFRKHIWRLIALQAILLAGSIMGSLVINVADAVSASTGALFNSILLAVEIYVGMRIMFALPAIVSEEIGPIDGLRRSWRLSHGNWLRIFGTSFLFGLMLLGFLGVLMFVSAFFVAGSGFIWVQEWLTSPTVTIDSTIHGFSSFIRTLAIFFSVPVFALFPLIPVYQTIFYYDLRTRLDGPLDYDEPRQTPASPAPTTPMWQP